MLEGGGGEVGEALRRIGREVLLGNAAEEDARKLRRDGEPGRRQASAGLLQEVTILGFALRPHAVLLRGAIFRSDRRPEFVLSFARIEGQGKWR
jgi:hypothetical protein